MPQKQTRKTRLLEKADALNKEIKLLAKKKKLINYYSFSDQELLSVGTKFLTGIIGAMTVQLRRMKSL